ncbi:MULTISPECIES: hypothetical protein [unclassified Bradyrhizobium]|uniref:hypothetical protein n=1 Tax=unclassified Bradyrhizobium TaxID=2631580 RepID=UPI0020B2EAD3|nr:MULTISPECIES: hypothetical protein [unclassified Bradyrhizobium]MCP3397106.1 hypothetical protein [Bradyrhizobium sp. CCGB20]MCP3405618.1 hypothetical protein [Bradyrhizobium sp. CCGB01]
MRASLFQASETILRPGTPIAGMKQRGAACKPVVAAVPGVQEIDRLDLPHSRIKHFAPASYAQAGQDIILEGILSARLFKSQKSRDSAFYVEIGANHPVSSSSIYLMYQRGALGVLVEPNPELATLIRTARPREPSVVLPAPQAFATLFIGNAHEPPQ